MKRKYQVGGLNMPQTFVPSNNFRGVFDEQNPFATQPYSQPPSATVANNNQQMVDKTLPFNNPSSPIPPSNNNTQGNTRRNSRGNGLQINWDKVFASTMVGNLGVGISNMFNNSYQNAALNYNRNKQNPTSYLPTNPNYSRQDYYGMDYMQWGGMSDPDAQFLFEEDAPKKAAEEMVSEQSRPQRQAKQQEEDWVDNFIPSRALRNAPSNVTYRNTQDAFDEENGATPTDYLFNVTTNPSPALSGSIAEILSRFPSLSSFNTLQRKFQQGGEYQVDDANTNDLDNCVECQEEQMKKGGHWIQKATAHMRTDHPCTGSKFGSSSCPPGSKRYNLAKTFRAMHHQLGGEIEQMQQGGIPPIYTNDPKDPRLKSYQDSLNLYLTYPKLPNVFNERDYTPSKGAVKTGTIKGLDSNNGNSDPFRNDKIKPYRQADFNNTTSAMYVDGNYIPSQNLVSTQYLYKKPEQQVIYKEAPQYGQENVARIPNVQVGESKTPSTLQDDGAYKMKGNIPVYTGAGTPLVGMLSGDNKTFYPDYDNTAKRTSSSLDMEALKKYFQTQSINPTIAPNGRLQFGGHINEYYPTPSMPFYVNGGEVDRIFSPLFSSEHVVDNTMVDVEDYKKGGIHIKPENRGKFTAYKKRTGKTTEEALHSKNPHVRQMANFARNAAKWHHQDGGMINTTGYLDNAPTANNPFNIIPGGDITMQGVSQPIMATPFKDGRALSSQIMQPGQDYNFDADFVHEMEIGGGIPYRHTSKGDVHADPVNYMQYGGIQFKDVLHRRAVDSLMKMLQKGGTFDLDEQQIDHLKRLGYKVEKA